MRIKSVCRALIAVTASLVALAGCSAAPGGAGRGGLEKTDIVIDAFPAIDSAGLFIAQQQGLFKAQGLNVTIKLAATSQTAIDGQLKGQFDITSADYVTYINNVLLNKAPLRIVAESSFLQPNVLTLLTKGGSEVKSVRQLQGKTVSVNAPNDIGTLLIDSLLADYSVPLNSVTFTSNVDFPHVGEYLAEGKVDAAFAPEPFVSLDGMAVGTTELADLDQGGTSDFPIQGIAVTRKWAQDNPHTLAAFERAYARGQEMAHTQRTAVEFALKQFLGMPPLAAALVSLPNFPVGVNSIRLQRLVDAMVRFGLLKQEYSGFKIKSVIAS